MKSTHRWALSLAVGALTLAVGAQTPSVRLYVSVVDAAGQPVGGLTAADFEIRDEGKPQNVTSASPAAGPVSVLVMLDMSASMSQSMELMKSGTAELMRQLQPDDRVRLGAFTDFIDFSPAFTTRRDEVQPYFQRLQGMRRRGSRLWDALNEGLSVGAAETHRRVLVTMTDGGDTDSRLKSKGDVERRAQDEGVSIYATGLYSEVLKLKEPPSSEIKRLAAATGGVAFVVKNAAEMAAAVAALAAEVHATYMLEFTPTIRDGKRHSLDVRVSRPRTTVRAKNHYQAAKVEK